jgi:hypothetical protein
MSRAVVSFTSMCQRFFDTCSAFAILALWMTFPAFIVSSRCCFRSCTPANADARTRCEERGDGVQAIEKWFYPDETDGLEFIYRGH